MLRCLSSVGRAAAGATQVALAAGMLLFGLFLLALGRLFARA